jgi:hypothetical protein
MAVEKRKMTEPASLTQTIAQVQVLQADIKDRCKVLKKPYDEEPMIKVFESIIYWVEKNYEEEEEG